MVGTDKKEGPSPADEMREIPAPPAQDDVSPALGDEAKQSAAGEESRLAELEAELEVERRERAAAEDQSLRWRADFENLRRRAIFESEQLRINLTQQIVAPLLPVADDLERALVTTGAEAAPSFLAGLEMVYRKLMAALAEQGLTRIEVAAGEPFDPEKHEAMLRAEDSGQPSNTIVEELRPGYVLGSRVIRPTLVRVQV